MVDARGGARLAPEALSLLAAGLAGADSLDRDRPVEAVVMRGVDDAHAAFSELAHDAIAAPSVPNRPSRLIILNETSFDMTASIGL